MKTVSFQLRSRHFVKTTNQNYAIGINGQVDVDGASMFRALLGIAANTGRVVCRVDGTARVTAVHYTVNQTGKTSFCC